MPITNTQKKYLRQSAHHLKPVIWVGQNGVNKSLINAIQQALTRHELIKIKLRLGERKDRDKGIEKICEDTDAELIQRVGNMLTLYKRNEEKPIIELP